MNRFPRNHGKPWTDADIKRLSNDLLYPFDWKVLADKFGRTQYAMKCQVDRMRRGVPNLWTTEVAGRFKEFMDTVSNERLIINGVDYDHKLELVKKLVGVKIDLLS